MASRTISLSEDAYDLLRHQKKPGESFSDVVRRLAGRRSPVEFIGAWGDMSQKELEDIKRDIRDSWKISERKWNRRMKRWD